jgi:hypothetical protein
VLLLPSLEFQSILLVIVEFSYFHMSNYEESAPFLIDEEIPDEDMWSATSEQAEDEKEEDDDISRIVDRECKKFVENAKGRLVVNNLKVRRVFGEDACPYTAWEIYASTFGRGVFLLCTLEMGFTMIGDDDEFGLFWEVLGKGSYSRSCEDPFALLKIPASPEEIRASLKPVLNWILTRMVIDLKVRDFYSYEGIFLQRMVFEDVKWNKHSWTSSYHIDDVHYTHNGPYTLTMQDIIRPDGVRTVCMYLNDCKIKVPEFAIDYTSEWQLVFGTLNPDQREAFRNSVREAVTHYEQQIRLAVCLVGRREIDPMQDKPNYLSGGAVRHPLGAGFMRNAANIMLKMMHG